MVNQKKANDSMADNNFALQVQNLRRTFGDFTAVDNISLEVKRGSIFGFLGPNGAGKSTTIRMLCGLLTPTGGSGTVGGFDVVRQPEAIKKIVGYMSQRFSLYEDLTVEENINFFSGIYNVSGEKRKERKAWVLQMAEIEGQKDRLARTLAGGFKQRLALGCAILHEPPIIFLDEPTSGVDPISRRNFWHLIGGMSEAGTTVFVTTHYMDEADYCDTLALIYRGRIIAEGTPTDLRRRYMRRDVLELEVDRPVEAMDLLSGKRIEAAIFGSTLHTTVEKAEADSKPLVALLEQAGLAVKRCEKIVPSLEDVFVTLIETS